MRRWISVLAILACANSARAEIPEAVGAMCADVQPPCADEDTLCWKCLVLYLATDAVRLKEENEILRNEWQAEHEAANAVEKLSHEALKEARRLNTDADPPWMKIVWGIGGFIAATGIVMGVTYSLRLR